MRGWLLLFAFRILSLKHLFEFSVVKLPPWPLAVPLPSIVSLLVVIYNKNTFQASTLVLHRSKALQAVARRPTDVASSTVVSRTTEVRTALHYVYVERRNGSSTCWRHVVTRSVSGWMAQSLRHNTVLPPWWITNHWNHTVFWFNTLV